MIMTEEEFHDLSNYIAQVKMEAELRSLIVQLGWKKSRKLLSQLEAKFL